MNTKLTLSMNSKLIVSARKYAGRKGVSLSRLVEEYFGRMTSPTLSKTQETYI